MFSRLLLLMSLIAAFMPWAFAQNATPVAPGFTYLYTLNCTLAPAIEIGDGPKGNRVAIPIIGGYFNGPRLSGEFLDSSSATSFLRPQWQRHAEQPQGNVSNLGADWGTTDNKTALFSADTRYNLVTNDGANIFIQTGGPQQPDGRLHLRQIFETGHPDYYWLNNIVAVGILSADPTGNGAWVSIDAWQVESPPATV